MDEAILASALRLLERRDHALGELRQKLSRKYPQQRDAVDVVLGYLQETGVIDDARFAREFVHYLQSTNPKGRLRLRQELQKKGIDSEVIQATLAELDDDETTLACQLAERKAASFPAGLERQKQQERLYRFLVSRGFDFDTARSATRQALEGMDSEAES